MNRLLRLAMLALALCFVAPVAAESGELPNWDRAAALREAADHHDPVQLDEWISRVDAGQASRVLAELQDSAGTGSPAFERQLFLLAQSMAEAPLDRGSDDLLAWLQDYQPRVRVAHEESATHGVALYAVAAAAQGSHMERQRRRAEQQSAGLLADPEHWVVTYQTAGPLQRQGMERALATARAELLQPLAATMQHELAAAPALALPAGQVAGRLSDPSLFLRAFQSAQGADSVQLLREAGWRLSATQRSRLFEAIVSQPEASPDASPDALTVWAPESARKQALGISILAPGLRGDSEVSERLLQLLDDPQLGAAAALALAGHPDRGVQDSLQLKSRQQGAGARRAALALGAAQGSALGASQVSNEAASETLQPAAQSDTE